MAWGHLYTGRTSLSQGRWHGVDQASRVLGHIQPWRGTGTAVVGTGGVPGVGALEALGGCRGTPPPRSELPVPVEHPSAGRASRCRSISLRRGARREPIPRGKGHSGRVEGRIRPVLTSPARVPAAEERHGPAPAPHPAPRARPSALLPPGATTAGRGGQRAAPPRAPRDTTPRTGVWGSPAACPCPHHCRHRGDRARPPPGNASLTFICPALLPAPSSRPFPPDGPCPRDLRISTLTLILILPAPFSRST